MCDKKYDPVTDMMVKIRDCQDCRCPDSTKEHNWEDEGVQWWCRSGNHGQ